jgi:hypothetical protein
VSTYSGQLVRLLTQSGVTGPERRPSVNVPAWSCRQLPFLGSSGVPELPRPAVSLWRAVVQGDPAAERHGETSDVRLQKHGDAYYRPLRKKDQYRPGAYCPHCARWMAEASYVVHVVSDGESCVGQAAE